MHFNRTCYAFQHSSSIKYMRHYFSTKGEMSNTERLRSRNFNQNYIKRISFGIHTAEPPDDWVCFRAVVLNVIITWELLCISCPELLVTVGTQLTRRCVVITTSPQFTWAVGLQTNWEQSGKTNRQDNVCCISLGRIFFYRANNLDFLKKLAQKFFKELWKLSNCISLFDSL